MTNGMLIMSIILVSAGTVPIVKMILEHIDIYKRHHIFRVYSGDIVNIIIAFVFYTMAIGCHPSVAEFYEMVCEKTLAWLNRPI